MYRIQTLTEQDTYSAKRSRMSAEIEARGGHRIPRTLQTEQVRSKLHTQDIIYGSSWISGRTGSEGVEGERSGGEGQAAEDDGASRGKGRTEEEGAEGKGDGRTTDDGGKHE